MGKKNQVQNEKKDSLKIYLLLPIILILAAFLRFYHLGSRGLYWDELPYTVEVAANSLSSIVATNWGSILYPLLLHSLLPFGNIEFMARLPAALFGLLSVLGIFLVGKLLLGKKEGLVAALMLAVSTHSIYFSQQARGYSGLLFFSLLSLYVFLKALKENRLLFWGLYTLFLALNIYNNFFGLVIVPVHLFYLAILALDKWLLKKNKKTLTIDSLKLARFSLSTIVALTLVFLLYLPVKTGINFFFHFQKSASNVLDLKGKTTAPFFSTIEGTFKRQFDYNTCPPLFFGKIILFLIGIVASVKREKKELILLLSYLFIPFFLLTLSKPPPGWMPADNKFTFIVPIILLLIAKAVVIIYKIFSEAISRLSGIQKRASLKTVIFIAFLLAILIMESVFLKDHYIYGLRLRSIHRSREVNHYLKRHIEANSMILFDDYLNKSCTLIATPLFSSLKRKLGVLIQESDGLNPSQKIGLFVVFNRIKLRNEYVSNLKSDSESLEISSLKNSSVVHFSSPDTLLLDKLTKIFHFFASLPIEKEEHIEYHLLLAKIYLLANKNGEALKEFDAIEKMKREVFPPKKPETQTIFDAHPIDKILNRRRGFYQQIVQDELLRQLRDLLAFNSEQLFRNGLYDEAILLQKKQIELAPQDEIFRADLAESYEKKGMRAEAEKEYKKALLLSSDLRTEEYILDKIRNFYALPSGYIIWDKKGTWHVRWWSKNKGVFTGRIQTSQPIQKIKAQNLSQEDTWKMLRNSLSFKGEAKGSKIKGLDILTRGDVDLIFDLKINEQRKIKDKIILITGKKLQD